MVQKTSGSTTVQDEDTGEKANVGLKSDVTTHGLHTISEVASFANDASLVPYLYQIQQGLIAGTSMKSVFGYNNNVKTTVEAISPMGTEMFYLTTASILDIQSTSNNDKSTSTGAHTIQIVGLDSNWDILTEFVNLDGTTTVNTTNSFLRINEVYVIAAGSDKRNIGDVTFEVSGVVYELMPQNNSQLASAKYSVPAGYTAYIIRGQFGAGSNTKTINVEVQIINNIIGVQYRPFQLRLLTDTDVNPAAFFPIGEKNDFNVRAKTTGGSGNIELSASFTIILKETA